MNNQRAILTILVCAILALPAIGSADEIYRLRMFFGLSLPSGGTVTLHDWQVFEQKKIAAAFEGFNVVDSTGYYKGKAEPSKIVTLIVEEKGIQKAKDLAKLYAKQFKQEAVMIVKIPVLEWSFVDAK